ncbi:type I methionyl aminopeptidase [bacterium]|nr:type I methionyl aminopeptidase [bacterium]
MIKKKSRDEIKLMKIAGDIVAQVHLAMKDAVKPGVTTAELDELAYDIIKKNKAIPTFKGYRGFPGTICASINDEVVHGIPSDKRILKDGDIIAVDVGATFRGLVGDSAWTYAVGNVSDECKLLLEGTEKALFAAIDKMRAGNTLNDVGGAVEDVAKEYKFGIVRQYGGHGVGRNMHEDPFVFNYRTGDNTILKPGMTIAIEPMLNLGGDAVYEHDDGWTVSTVDKRASAHFEHTILVTEDEPVILTSLSGKQ